VRFRGILIRDETDANLFREDDGRLYLYYSYAPPVYVRRLTGLLRVERMATPLETDGDPIDLLRSESWERFLGIIGILEEPWMLKRNGTYYLMYSYNGGINDGKQNRSGCERWRQACDDHCGLR
jgi:beta-xylosidase